MIILEGQLDAVHKYNYCLIKLKLIKNYKIKGMVESLPLPQPLPQAAGHNGHQRNHEPPN